MTTREILIAARKLIADPKRDDAYSFCMLGAVNHFTTTCREGEVAIDLLADRLPHARPVWSFNDDPTTTHADVLALFDMAIAESNA